MSNALKTTATGGIVIGGLTFTATGIECDIAKPPSIAIVRRAVKFVGRGISGTNWWAGDLANNAEQWGEEYVELLGELTLPEETQRNLAWVSDRVKPVNRLTNLSWTHHQAVAPLTPTQQKNWLKKAQPKEGELKPQLSVSQLKRAIRESQPEPETPPLPDGTYNLIYADPPWRYEHCKTDNRKIENQYPTMELDDICALEVQSVAAPDCVLFLWATSPKLSESIQVIEAWGFNYRTCMAWVKDRIGMGYYARQRHELLLIATQGTPHPPSESNRPDSVTEAPREEHSKKPDRFYEIIESMYPKAEKVELFCRRPREGWTAWGNEVNNGGA